MLISMLIISIIILTYQFQSMKTISILFFFVCVILAIKIQEIDGLNLDPYRTLISKRNVEYIEEHNRNPKSTYKMQAYRQFVALTEEEVRAKYFMDPVDTYKLHLAPSSGIKVQTSKLEKQLKAYFVDLTTTYGTPVQNQGQCGNCYAYSTTDSVNFINKKFAKNYPLLSFQDLTDCSKGYYNNNGCKGGGLYESMEWQRIYGVRNLSIYPQNIGTYLNGTQQACQNTVGTKFKIARWYYFNAASCIDRISILLQGYAISIALAGGNPSFYNYKSGVLSDCTGTRALDHAVVLVGAYYDPANVAGSYLKIKNSWGVGWGEGGYVRISMSAGISCMACLYGAFGGQ